ncbi:hypothetical protein LNTAR_16678 [Lentisphaera araneosa HTCC2155]|uniref:LITAF domain-containing protein n=1 Tax=Lentisphaera araneosa HTCC2155 TaxID=313628 RepID=A6DQF0_9BACT|nr:hypothetical protein LNTAR_16678 [Lentisphaera araneosa HTCC2155]
MSEQYSNIKCSNCQSLKTRVIHPINSRPSKSGVLFIGWFYLLFQCAFSKSKLICDSCNHEEAYSTVLSWLALFSLFFLIIIIFNSN